MTNVRVLVGTAKGAFVLTSDGSRRNWKISQPQFPGWEAWHLKGSPADPSRVYASQWTGWHGQVVQRSDDGGQSWNPVGNEFAYATQAGTHKFYDGSDHPWEFARVWHFEPSPDDPDTVYAGAEDAALFRSTDGGKTWAELDGVRTHPSAPEWQPGAGGLGLHTIIVDPNDASRIFVAISAAGMLRSTDRGATWEMANTGLISEDMPDPNNSVGHCVHNLAMHPSKPETIYLRSHWDVWRSDNAGGKFEKITNNLPSDFGFPVTVDANDPDTVFVVPMVSGSEHYPPDGALRVYRSRNRGDEWEPMTKGLPQRDCYVNVLRDAMSTDTLDPCGLYFGTTSGQVYGSADGGDSWTVVADHLPRVLSVEAQAIG